MTLDYPTKDNCKFDYKETIEIILPCITMIKNNVDFNSFHANIYKDCKIIKKLKRSDIAYIKKTNKLNQYFTNN